MPLRVEAVVRLLEGAAATGKVVASIARRLVTAICERHHREERELAAADRQLGGLEGKREQSAHTLSGHGIEEQRKVLPLGGDAHAAKGARQCGRRK